MKLDIENYLPDGVQLISGNPESVNFDSDKSHVIMRFAVEPIEPEPELHAELKAQYEKDVEACKSIDGLEAWQLFQYCYNGKWNDCADKPYWQPGTSYRRHPHADLIIQYHKCSDADKARWECFDDDLQIWRPCKNPAWHDSNKYRLKPRTITINGKEYNAPLNVAPDIGFDYWYFDVTEIEFSKWKNTEQDLYWLKNNRAFSNFNDCENVFNAFNEILAGA